MNRPRKKDLLSITDLTSAEIENLLIAAGGLKQAEEDYQPLKGKVLAMIFMKRSTRTRVSFQVGMFKLGGSAIFLSPDEIQLSRGEGIEDTARVLSRYVDGILIRTHEHKIAELVASHADVPVINGLTDLLHPCQVISDLFTISERRGNLTGQKIAYIGDGNNMAHSWLYAAARMGFHLALAVPETYAPHPKVLAQSREIGKETGAVIEITDDPALAAADADVIYTDVWVSMGQEAGQLERINHFRPFQVNEKLLKRAKPDVLFMHCLPAHRGEEVTREVLEGPNSIILDQAENRMYVQQAILVSLMAGT
ncbi:MAG: ornithine carbamoyltransferase [bacterium]